MDNRYAPPQAPVSEVPEEPGGAKRGSIRAWIHILLASGLLFAVAVYLLRLTLRLHVWVWLTDVAALLLTGGLLLLRRRWARYPVWGLAAFHVGVWLYAMIRSPGNIPWSQQPWLVSVLMFVPGIALIVAPAAYCIYVARTYAR